MLFLKRTPETKTLALGIIMGLNALTLSVLAKPQAVTTAAVPSPLMIPHLTLPKAEEVLDLKTPFFTKPESLNQLAVGGMDTGSGVGFITADGRIEILDLEEAHDEKIPVDLGPGNLSTMEKVAYVLNQISKVAPARASLYYKWASTFADEIEWKTDQEIVVPSNLLEALIPSGSTPVGFAFQRSDDSVDLGKKRYVFQLKHFMKLNTDSQAVLILHELVYRDLLGKDKSKSNQVRHIVKQFISKNFNLQAYQVLMGYQLFPQNELYGELALGYWEPWMDTGSSVYKPKIYYTKKGKLLAVSNKLMPELLDKYFKGWDFHSQPQGYAGYSRWYLGAAGTDSTPGIFENTLMKLKIVSQNVLSFTRETPSPAVPADFINSNIDIRDVVYKDSKVASNSIKSFSFGDLDVQKVQNKSGTTSFELNCVSADGDCSEILLETYRVIAGLNNELTEYIKIKFNNEWSTIVVKKENASYDTVNKIRFTFNKTQICFSEFSMSKPVFEIQGPLKVGDCMPLDLSAK